MPFITIYKTILPSLWLWPWGSEVIWSQRDMKYQQCKNDIHVGLSQTPKKSPQNGRR